MKAHPRERAFKMWEEKASVFQIVAELEIGATQVRNYIKEFNFNKKLMDGLKKEKPFKYIRSVELELWHLYGLKVKKKPYDAEKMHSLEFIYKTYNRQ